MLKKNLKIVLISNSSWYIYNFRMPLILKIKTIGYDLVIVAPKDRYSELIELKGFKLINWDLNRSSMNPLRELISIIRLFLIIRQENPKLIHNFTIKACVYGTIVSRFFKNIYVINAITGLGHLFISNKLKTKIIRTFIKPIYKFIFRTRRSYFIFQNLDDRNFLNRIGITASKRSRLIKGSGVDINHFKSETNFINDFSNPVQLLFPSRIIREKGFNELLIAFQSLVEKGENLKLLIAGNPDMGNKSRISDKEIKSIHKNKNIVMLGHVKNMKKVYQESDIVIMPSWREGLSRSLIEAAAMQKPIITTNVPGCRDIIDHGISGLLVPPKDSKSIELAILLLIQNQELSKKLANNARKKVVKEFEVNMINNQTIEQYEEIFRNT